MAPAIGIAAAYGMVLAERAGADLARSAAQLRAARPTAVNLAWAVDRMLRAYAKGRNPLDEARAIHSEDRACAKRSDAMVRH